MKAKEWRSTWMTKKERRALVPPEPERHTEICDQILAEMRVISQVEWFNIAKRSKPGIPGFSPMRQLQMKMREKPLTFPVELTGIFQLEDGRIVQRIIQWPVTGWKVVKMLATMRGYIAKDALDLHPYRLIDPIMDELEDRMARYGDDHPYTQTTVRKLLKACLRDFRDARQAI